MSKVKLITKKEASEILSCHVRTLERIISSGKLAKVKIRGLVRLQLKDVMNLAEKGC